MIAKVFCFLVLAVLLNHSCALPWDGPQQTPYNNDQQLPVAGWTPKPTHAPSWEGLFKPFEKRQLGFHTCGWKNGNPGQAVYCQKDYVCATDAYYSVNGCCNPGLIDSCQLYTACYNGSAVAASCDETCQSNARNAVCTEKFAPECFNIIQVYIRGTNTFSYPGYGCSKTAFTWTVLETYSGESPIPYDPVASIPPPQGVATSFSTGTPVVSTNTRQPSPAAINKSGASQPSSKIILPSETAASTKTTVPTGTLVGAVIGGVAILALGAVVVTWMILRQKRRNSGLERPYSGALGFISQYEKPQESDDVQNRPMLFKHGYHGSTDESRNELMGREQSRLYEVPENPKEPIELGSGGMST